MTSPPTLPKAPAAAVAAPEPVNLDVYQAILAASSEFGSLTKDAANTYLRSNYLSLPALLKAVREPLSDQGVVITSSFVQVGSQFVIRTVLHHCGSGTEISSDFPVLDMSSPQKVGACSTYALRYSLLHLLGIAAADDRRAIPSATRSSTLALILRASSALLRKTFPNPLNPKPGYDPHQHLDQHVQTRGLLAA